MAHDILLVDDDAGVLAALRRCLLEEDGCRVRTAKGAAEALESLDVQPADVVIADHDMPKTSGAELLREVQRRFPDTVRLMISGKADVEIAFETVNAGVAYRFLEKPWEEHDIRLVVRLALEHRHDRLRNAELSRLLDGQAALFAAIVARHPDCLELVEAYMTGVEDAAPEKVEA